MSRIVMATFGSYGDLFPYLALGQELLRRGHAAVVATAEEYRGHVTRAGLEFAPTRPDVSLDDRALLTRVMDPRRGAEVVVKELVVPALRNTYADLEQATEGADLLLSHVLTYAAPILGEKRNMPWVSTVLSPMVFCSAYDPPALAPIPWLAALRRLGPRLNSVLLRMLKRISRGWAEPIRRFRRELGLPDGADPLWEGQHSPHGVLALFSESFARPQPDWPANTTVCGFPFYDDGFGDGLAEFERFAEQGPSPIAFTLGSSAVQAAGDFYEQALQAALRLKARAVLVAGPNADRFQQVPPEILVLRTIPFRPLFARCSAVVHAGGVGTIALALRAGVPQVVVPFAHDQFDNANRVESMQCGVRLRRRPTAAALASALESVFDRRAAQTATAASIIRRENGVGTACDVIDRTLAESYAAAK
jgi:UDP:flavonoid glycosyltransferase YjiC (YdhE family)